MTYQEAKDAKRQAEKERRQRRDMFTTIRHAALAGDVGAVTIWNRLTAGRAANGCATVAGTVYDVDSKGTYRRAAV